MSRWRHWHLRLSCCCTLLPLQLQRCCWRLLVLSLRQKGGRLSDIEIIFRLRDSSNLETRVFELELEVGDATHLKAPLASLHLDERSNRGRELPSILQISQLILIQRQRLPTIYRLQHTIRIVYLNLVRIVAMVGGDDSSRLQPVNNRVQLCEIHTWVDRAVVHLQSVLKWLQKGRIVDGMRVGED